MNMILVGINFEVKGKKEKLLLICPAYRRQLQKKTLKNNMSNASSKSKFSLKFI